MKRLWFNIVIFFGCFLLLITVLGAVLVMAPGMELLGVMYIRSTSGSADTAKTVTDAAKNKQILIESNNIPVYIQFVQSYDVTARLTEEYDGFAKAGPSPTLDVELTTKGIEIKSHEYETFLFNSRTENSGLFVSVPIYYHNKIIVKTKKSSVTFSGLEGSLSDVNITTEAEVNFKNDLKVKNLELTLGNKNAVVSEEVNIDGYIIATSNRGSLTLPDGFTGNVTFSSNSGDLKLASCGDLIFKSKTGSVLKNENAATVFGDAVISTNGDVNIKSVAKTVSINAKNGDVNLGADGIKFEDIVNISTDGGTINMLGEYTNENNKISSKSGKIKIDTIKNANVQNKYGNISVSKADNLSLSTKSGDVYVNESVSHITITTNNGNVTMGSSAENKKISGATITTIGGDVTVFNASGENYNIKTNAGNVKFVQNKSQKTNISIESNHGDVSLYDINGPTVCKTKGEIYASIYEMNGKIVLNGKNRNVSVSVQDTCYYSLTSKKNIEAAPDLTEKVKHYSTIPVSGSHENSTLEITTNKGKISVAKI